MVRMPARTTVIWRLEWGWRVCSQFASITWLLAGVSSPHYVDFSMEMLDWIHNTELTSTRGKDPRVGANRKPQHLLWPTLWSHTLSQIFIPINLLLVLSQIFLRFLKGTSIWCVLSSEHTPSLLRRLTKVPGHRLYARGTWRSIVPPCWSVACWGLL